jgi:hypothetical protein
MNDTPQPQREALPCPFCGNDKIEAKDYSGDSYSCGTHGPEESYEKAAVEAWNRRVPSPDSRPSALVSAVKALERHGAHDITCRHLPCECGLGQAIREGREAMAGAAPDSRAVGVTEEVVERACAAYWKEENRAEQGGGNPWPRCGDGSAEYGAIVAIEYRRRMRAALSAALGERA